MKQKKKQKQRKCKRCGELIDISTFSSYITSDNRKYYSKICPRKYYSKICPECELAPSQLTPKKKKYYQDKINDDGYISQAIYNMAYTIVEQVYA